MPAFEKCSWHKDDGFDYNMIASSVDAEERMKKGQRQLQCPECKLWIWPDMMGKPPVSKPETK